MISKVCTAMVLVGLGGIAASLAMPVAMLGYCAGKLYQGASRSSVGQKR
jgi:hypothetical protein